MAKYNFYSHLQQLFVKLEPCFLQNNYSYIYFVSRVPLCPKYLVRNSAKIQLTFNARLLFPKALQNDILLLLVSFLIKKLQSLCDYSLDYAALGLFLGNNRRALIVS